MRVDMDGAYDEKPQFDFYPKADCTPGKKCVKLTKDSDAIIFHGKLTKAFARYAAKLADGKEFTFTFGKETTPPVLPAEQTTVKPASTRSSTDMTHPKPEQSTNEPKPSKPTDASISTDNNTGADEQETVPITSSGSLDTASVTTLLLFTVIPILSNSNCHF